MNAAYSLSTNSSNCLWSVPRPILYDAEKSLIVMEFVDGRSLFEFLTKDSQEQSPSDAQAQQQYRHDQLEWITNAVVAFTHDVAGLALDPSILRATNDNPVFEYM